jgi:DNA replication and repair protein RecF
MIAGLENQGFRNLKECSLQFPEGVVIVHGENGQGKSNLLEAIHLLCQGFSPRTRTLANAIGWDAESAVLRGQASGSERAIQIQKKSVKAKLGEEHSKNASLLFGEAPVVQMAPPDILLAQGGPEYRRSYIDELICYLKKTNLKLLKDYKKVLAERNAWLKAVAAGEAPTGGEDLFEVLTAQLAALAEAVWQERTELVAHIAPLATELYHTIAPSEHLTLFYNKYLTQTDYLKKLAGQKNAERALGLTLSGPHRDDCVLLFDGRPMRESASQGQCRSASLALRFASIALLNTKLQTPPILLLDDIFAELDTKRRGALLGVLQNSHSQVFIASPNRDDLPFAGDAVFCVKNGTILNL